MKIAYNIFHITDSSETSIIRRNLFKSATDFLDTYLPKLQTPTINLLNLESAEKFIISNDDFNPLTEFKPGELGIWASNYTSWKKLLDSDYDALINLEDDIFLMCDFYDKLQILLQDIPEDWDFFTLYVPPNQEYLYRSELNVTENVCFSFQGWSLLACMVSRKGAKKALDIMKDGFHDPLDFYILKSPEKFKVYSITPKFENIVSLITLPSSFQQKSDKVEIKESFFSDISIKNKFNQKIDSFVLYLNFYVDKNSDRQIELDFCLLENIKNRLFNKFVIVCNGIDRDYLLKIIPKDSLSRIVIEEREDRPTYNTFFSLMSKYSSETNHLNFLTNSDIIFPEKTLVESKPFFSVPKICLSLTRYDILNIERYLENSEFFGMSYSQDVWIFQGSPSIIRGADFTLGVLGCDNSLAKILSTEGFIVKNPSLTLKIYHLHLTDIRNYDEESRLRLPYKFVPITN